MYWMNLYILRMFQVYELDISIISQAFFLKILIYKEDFFKTSGSKKFIPEKGNGVSELSFT